MVRDASFRSHASRSPPSLTLSFLSPLLVSLLASPIIARKQERQGRTNEESEWEGVNGESGRTQLPCPRKRTERTRPSDEEGIDEGSAFPFPMSWKASPEGISFLFFPLPSLSFTAAVISFSYPYLSPALLIFLSRR